MLLRPAHRQPGLPLGPPRRAPRGGHPDLFGPGEVLPGERFGAAGDVRRGPAGHHLPPVHPRPGAEVHDVVGRLHRLQVVLHHHHGVADVAQVLQGPDQLPVVPLVEPDGGLVQDVQHPHQATADLAGQADPLRLAPGEGGRRAVKGEVVQAHVEQEPQAPPDLLQQLGGDRLLPLRQDQALEVGQGPGHGEAPHVHQALAPHRHRPRLRAQLGPPAGGAGLLGEELHIVLPGPVRAGLLEHPAQAGQDPLPLGEPGAPRAILVLPGDLDPLPFAPVQQELALVLGELVEGDVGGDPVVGQHLGPVALAPGVGVAGVLLLPPGDHRSLADGLALVRDHQVEVDLHRRPQPQALRAGPDGAVEGEELRTQLVEGEPAVEAGVLLREEEVARAGGHPLQPPS